MDKISNRVKQIRKLKQRSLHDCAKLLGVSKEKYLQFEEGDASLSLPEIELLAFFFEIPPELFFEKSKIYFDFSSILEENKKPIFTKLRNKIIGAQLAFTRENNGLSLEDLNNQTGIPIEVLKTYENNSAAIPLDRLVLICNQLNLPVQSLLFQIQTTDEDVDQYSEQAEWQPDFPEHEYDDKDENEDLYLQVIRGMKSIPEKDQAEIAKMILQRLKTL